MTGDIQQPEAAASNSGTQGSEYGPQVGNETDEVAELIQKMDFAMDRLPEILQSLRRHPRLPTPAEVPELLRLHGNEPVLLEQPVTVGEMAAHVMGTSKQSSEIALQIFGDSYVMFAGVRGRVDNPPHDWMLLMEQQATTMIHTHPGELLDDNHRPSPDDLEGAELSLPVHAVISQKGIVLYPNMPEYIGSGLPRLEEYIESIQFIPTGDKVKDYWRLMNSYTVDVLHLQLVPWDALPKDLTLQEAIDYASNLRKQQFAQNNFGAARPDESPPPALPAPSGR
jgi:hypothetical protein